MDDTPPLPLSGKVRSAIDFGSVDRADVFYLLKRDPSNLAYGTLGHRVCRYLAAWEDPDPLQRERDAALCLRIRFGNGDPLPELLDEILERLEVAWKRERGRSSSRYEMYNRVRPAWERYQALLSEEEENDKRDGIGRKQHPRGTPRERAQERLNEDPNLKIRGDRLRNILSEFGRIWGDFYDEDPDWTFENGPKH